MNQKYFKKGVLFFVLIQVFTINNIYAEGNDYFLHDSDFVEKVLPLCADEPFQGEHYLASDYGIYTVRYWLGREEDNDELKYYRPSTLFESNSEFWSWIATKFIDHMKTTFIHSLLKSGEINPENLEENLKVELKIPDIEAYEFKFRLPSNDSFIFSIQHDVIENVPTSLKPVLPMNEVFEETAGWVYKNIKYEANHRLKCLNQAALDAFEKERIATMYL